MTVSFETQVQATMMLDELAEAVGDLRARFPLDDYAGRVYRCDRCGSFDAVAAPADELPDDYPCPTCRRPQVPVTYAGQPRPNRAARRARRRR